MQQDLQWALLGRIGSMRKKENGVGLVLELRFGQHLSVLLQMPVHCAQRGSPLPRGFKEDF